MGAHQERQQAPLVGYSSKLGSGTQADGAGPHATPIIPGLVPGPIGQAVGSASGALPINVPASENSAMFQPRHDRTIIGIELITEAAKIQHEVDKLSDTIMDAPSQGPQSTSENGSISVIDASLAGIGQSFNGTSGLSSRHSSLQISSDESETSSNSSRGRRARHCAAPTTRAYTALDENVILQRFLHPEENEGLRLLSRSTL
ncbi:hypothetical protein P152DRAFT_472377 [Eremomyces bilateralis CBS 781.70]|uniref:Uncharacterized protein n=1 Tax=Eremomyces bilateralis CBS 781.70 TaxID=1392243 RepID=A0A6G1G982_9PEZI|nr:uncharacterized protein P152DRAFT_472377 [Eremomyces bilateralis CBS 781.70]KAF1814637.1 hypothetical protein P152DRAFT_472377 [Eremomyces bilateralis CBS 781.70]